MVLLEFRRPGPGSLLTQRWRPRVTVCSPAQPKPSGHYFPGQWFSALPLKPPWAWAQLLHSAPTHFHLPEVHSPSLLALPKAWIYLPVNKTVSQPPRLALILSPACSSPGHHSPVPQDPRAPSSALRGTQAEGPPGLWVHFSPGHISKCTKHGRGPITWEGGNSAHQHWLSIKVAVIVSSSIITAAICCLLC